MSFDEAAACLSLGIGGVLFVIAVIRAYGSDDFDHASLEGEDWVLAGLFISAIIGAPTWCLIVGLHWLIKAW